MHAWKALRSAKVEFVSSTTLSARFMKTKKQIVVKMNSAMSLGMLLFYLKVITDAQRHKWIYQLDKKSYGKV